MSPIRALEDPTSGEPVVPVAEGLYAVPLGQTRPGRSRLGEPEVVEAEIGGEVRLDVTAEQRAARAVLVHSVKPGPHHSSFSATGWNWGR